MTKMLFILNDEEVPYERVVAAWALTRQIARLTLTTESECGQCEGTGSTQSASNLADEPCPVCEGSGQIDLGLSEEGAGEALDALIEKARRIATGATEDTALVDLIPFSEG